VPAPVLELRLLAEGVVQVGDGIYGGIGHGGWLATLVEAIFGQDAFGRGDGGAVSIRIIGKMSLTVKRISDLNSL